MGTRFIRVLSVAIGTRAGSMWGANGWRRRLGTTCSMSWSLCRRAKLGADGLALLRDTACLGVKFMVPGDS
jgi:hypothetical protein